MNKESKSPWKFATKDGRDYLTPEDITASIKSGYDKLTLYEEVLLAIGRKECEDPSLCAHVTVYNTLSIEIGRLK